ncbi:MAG: RusA family crossover junction endodeoxyribonuclease [Pseudomonadota bacterium]
MEPIKIILKTLPLSINQSYKSGKGVFYKSQKAKETQEAIQWEMRAQYRGKPLTGPLKISLTFFWPDMRRHDIDGPLKGLFDAGNGILYEDDSQIVWLRDITKVVDEERPRVEMLLSEA